MNGLEDFRVAAATADMPIHSGQDLRVGRMRLFNEQGDGAHDHAGRAVAALQGAFGEKRLLLRLKRLA